MKVVFCTLFDRHYLGKGLLMIRSLRRQCSGAAPQVYVLCLDRVVLEYFQLFPEPGVELMALEALEEADPALLRAKRDRSRVEYYFTLSPCWPRHLLLSGEWEAVVSLDADLYFFADPMPLVGSLGEKPIFITDHGYDRKVRRAGLRTGRFNVSFQGFRNDPVALACLDQWRKQCLKWCRSQVDERRGRFADQRYLDRWPEDFAGSVTLLLPPGPGLAPWNVARWELRVRDGELFVGAARVIFYHFQGLRGLGGGFMEDRLWRYQVALSGVAEQQLYGPYLRELWRTEQEIDSVLGAVACGGRPGWWRLWRAQTYFDLSGEGVRHGDLSGWHVVQRGWRWVKGHFPPPSAGGVPGWRRGWARLRRWWRRAGRVWGMG